MKKKNLGTKTFSALMSATMMLSLCPTTVLAATGSEVAKDGEYSATAHVTNDPENEEEWKEYDVSVELTVSDGVFSDIIVTPDSTYDKEKNQSYFSKAYNKSKGIQTKLVGKPATEDTINSWDTVSGATCTSSAVKEAALEAIRGAESADETETLAPVEEQNIEYVLMNIPYAQFYAADLNNDIAVDAFTSATKNKVRTGSLAGGSYHVDATGDEITGVTFPVKVPEGMDLSTYTKITDESSVDVTVTNRGQTTTKTYAGKEALFESATYSYYVLTETPSYYKEVTVGEDGSLRFGATQGTVNTVTGITADLMTESSYGDYELSLSELENTVDHDTDQIYGVVIHTEEGSDYGLRHLENIWLGTELAWSTGFTDAVHNCPTSSAHYQAMMGQTINKITYYTSKGIFEIPLEETVYVPVKFDNSVSVSNAAVTSGKTTITTEGLPEDYDPQYRVDGLKNVMVSENELNFNAEKATKGNYTVVISDKNGKYADLTADFMLYTEEMPAAYNENGENPALEVSEGASEEQFKDFIANISSVDVNGTNYPATGRGAVTIINEDGTLNLTAAPFVSQARQVEADATFDIVIHATGYPDLAFQYIKSASDPVIEIITTDLEKAISDAEALTETDYTAESWNTLQIALSTAKSVLETKESQEAIDGAETTLNDAITALQRNESNTQNTPGTNSSDTGSNGNKTDTDGNATEITNGNTATAGGNTVTTGGNTVTTGGNTTAASTSPKTGDYTNIMGWLSAAMLSVGAGFVTIVMKRKKR